MSDRTYNTTDARLYDEDWSPGAIIVANCVITRCPNQYGVFDMPWGFINRFFAGIFSKTEIQGFAQEWEAAGFAKFFRDRSVIWIVKKWRRAGKPSTNHWKGVIEHLTGYPEVSRDFLSYYEPHWRGIEGGSKPHANPDSESDSESESESDTEKIPKKESKKEGDSDKSELPRALLDFVDELFPPDKFRWSKAERQKHVKALDDLTRLDGYPQEEVFAVLRWMRQDVTEQGDWHGWSTVFNSIPALRVAGCKKYLNARSQFQRNGKSSKHIEIYDPSTGKTVRTVRK